MSDHDVPARSRAFDAVVRVAICNAQESSRWRSGFDTADVEAAVSGDVSTRTVRRALKDGQELGWVAGSRSSSWGWRPGERAEEYVPAEVASADVDE